MNNADLQNQCHIIAEVTGSNPVPPTTLYSTWNSYLFKGYWHAPTKDTTC